ncbi:MAG: 3-phosphoshikimate 1-carboxyvinyltransferase, partial [Lachnospiraceae bacterium]|nr:3-phosphoshikimate 1-carboxyvinyltransferase [Lachnospiraceae bacterium]
RDAAELKVKETDRIRTVTENLLAMGADVTPTDDGMIIEGKAAMQGALIHTCGDHRIAMSFAVASLVADGQTVLDDHACASVSYPSFYKDLAGLAE